MVAFAEHGSDNLQGSIKAENFFNSKATVGLSRRPCCMVLKLASPYCFHRSKFSLPLLILLARTLQVNKLLTSVRVGVKI